MTFEDLSFVDVSHAMHAGKRHVNNPELKAWISFSLLQTMDKLEIVITALLVCLVAVAVYAATSWTLSRKKKCYEEPDHDKDEGHYKYQENEIDYARKKVATAYAKETMPRITLTPVQPRAVFPKVSNTLFSLWTAPRDHSLKRSWSKGRFISNGLFSLL